MGQGFASIAFTDSVKAAQQRQGSRDGYARFESDEEPGVTLGDAEAAFIARRDSFYMATVSETGWPYVQHRGGPAGFLRVLDGRRIAFADFRGNRQYVSVGNLAGDDRVSLILVDYAQRRRLKLLGRARLVEADEDPALMAAVGLPEYRAKVERAFVITVEALDWNCPQHITPRLTVPEVEKLMAPLVARIEELERLLAGSAASVDRLVPAS